MKQDYAAFQAELKAAFQAEAKAEFEALDAEEMAAELAAEIRFEEQLCGPRQIIMSAEATNPAYEIAAAGFEEMGWRMSGAPCDMEQDLTEITVTRIPECDFCGDTTPALYDGKTGYGSWANMCRYHFEKFGVGLGLGKGQRLILKEEQTDK